MNGLAGKYIRGVIALAVLYVALALSPRLDDNPLPALIRLPLELPILLLLLVAARSRAVGIAAAVVLTPVVLIKFANMGVYFVFARTLNPVADALMAPVALDTLARMGAWIIVSSIAGIVVLIGGLGAALLWAMRTVQRDFARLPTAAVAVAGFAAALVVPIGNADSSLFVRDQAAAAVSGVRAAGVFRDELAKDDPATFPRTQLLADLKGSDVLLIFVEAYGRSALDNPDYAPVIAARLTQFEAALADKGFAARSAWLNSPTYGGESYLAHSTFVSGLWISDQQRYAQLLRSGRRTLVQDFRDAGWRTVAVMPEVTLPWPEGDYFGHDKLHDATNMGYAGEPFGYMTMPDQYSLAAFQVRELAAADRKPVMAEIALISSHIPWTPVPKFVPWDHVGDGTVFTTARTTEDANTIWRDPKRLRQYYAMSLDYVLETLASFIATYGSDNMLVIVVGDHQPMGFMADSESRDVPVHIIAKDPARLAALGGDWAAGMTPDAASPVAPMSTMRARILRAFTPDGTVSPPPTQ